MNHIPQTNRKRHPLDRSSWRGDQHVMPGWEDHESSPACSCCPRVTYEDPETGYRVWTHRVTN